MIIRNSIAIGLSVALLHDHRHNLPVGTMLNMLGGLLRVTIPMRVMMIRIVTIGDEQRYIFYKILKKVLDIWIRFCFLKC